MKVVSLLGLISIMMSFDVHAKGSMLRQQLPASWEFRQADQLEWLPAQVPGCVHTDLLSKHVIPDPYFGLNETELQWIGEKDWDYRTTFRADSTLLQRRHVELVFEGLDTYAEVFLNGVSILQADNMFRTWRTDVKPHLRTGENEIRIYFTSVFHENLPKWAKAPFRLMAFPNNDQADVRVNMYSRKAGFHFGWDWGPRLITCGIWRPAYLQAWDDYRLMDVRYVQKALNDNRADLEAVFTITADANLQIPLSINTPEKQLAQRSVTLHPGEQQIVLPFSIAKPRRWWCNGLGEPHLYTMTANSGDQSLTSNIGLRTLRVVRETDEHGRSLYIELNGVPVFMKGANYIPQDNFQNRVTAHRMEHIVRSAAQANMNMLRIWGGGIYEDDIFYDLCDRYGILIWHDMMFACAMYPADAHYLDNVRAEVLDNVRRLRNHPCIALFCGNNENEVGWYTWGWKELYPAEIQARYEADMHKLFHEVIPQAIAEADPERYYHPSSPIAGFNHVGYGEGDIHYWGVWHGKEPFSHFKKNIARFVSEYGFQSYPEAATIAAFTYPEDRSLHSPVMLSHQRCMADERRDREYGNRLIRTYMEQSYRVPKDFDSYLYLSQVVQAEGVRQAIEAHRSAMPYCMGSLFWQIDDCWPVASWSSIDYYGRWKALHYVARKAYAPFLIVPAVESETLTVRIVSDDLKDTVARLTLTLRDFHGRIVKSDQKEILIKANSAALHYEAQVSTWLSKDDTANVMLYVELQKNEKRLSDACHYFAEVKDLQLPMPILHYDLKKVQAGYDIRLRSEVLVKNICLSTDAGDGKFSDNYFDLFPGLPVSVLYSEGADLQGRLKITSIRDTYE